MFVTGIGTANPPQRFTKTDCWEAFKASAWFHKLDRRAHAIAETVLLRDNGIESRALAFAQFSEVFRIDPDTLHQRFLAHAPALAQQAADRALEAAGLDAAEIDGLVISTCTGYLCPGLTSYVVESLGLRHDVMAYDLVGQGCAAALPNWRMAAALLASGSCRHVLSICVEISSAAMYLDNDPGVLVSACLFGDGAGAAVLSRHPARGRRIEWKAHAALMNPAQRGALLFENRGGMLRNVLTRPVPKLAAAHAQQVLHTVLRREGVSAGDISTWILHAGGRDVLLELQKSLAISAHELRYSADILREYGNMSSASVYFVMQAALADDAAGGWWWMSAFGAGFSCHGALLQVG